MFYAGIDVSKHQLDLFFDTLHRLPNSQAGFECLASLLPSGCVVVMESTGGYERACASFLRKAGLGVRIVNPAEVAAFRRSLGRRAKTDPIDARVLALFGEARKLEPRAEPAHVELKAAVGRLGQLRQILTAEKNRLEQAQDFERESVLRLVDFLKREAKLCRERIRGLIRESDSLRAKVEVLTQLKGIGEVVASTLVAALPEIGRVGGKQIASLAGLAPHPHDSGGFKGKRRIGGGRAIVRSMLYLAAMSASRRAGVLHDMYQRLRAAGKPAKVAIIACAHKLLTIANARIRDLLSLEGGRSAAPLLRVA
jgi:transposase